MRRFTVELDSAAFADLDDIRRYLSAERGEAFARRFLGRLFTHLHGFSTAPLRGRVHEEVRPGLRVVGWRKTLTIAFVVDEEKTHVLILGVLYRGRDWKAVMQERGAED